MRVNLYAYLTVILGASIANAAVVTQTHTLYYVAEPTPTTPVLASFEAHESTDYLPIATLDGGSVTRYQQVVVQSLAVIHNASPTDSADAIPITLVSQPFTKTFTFDEGSATYHQSNAPSTATVGPGVIQRVFEATEDCSLDIGKQSGSCVRVQVVPLLDQSAGGVSTTTNSWSGSLVPYATITSTATSGSASTSPFSAGIAVSLLGALAGALLL